MKFDIPFIPLSVEFRPRPLRRFRVSIQGLLLLITVVALILGLVRETRRRHAAMMYHNAQFHRIMSRRTPIYDPKPLAVWHLDEARRHRRVWSALETTALVLIVAVGAAVVIYPGWRLLALLSKRDPVQPPAG